jgi:hypothetical protein
MSAATRMNDPPLFGATHWYAAHKLPNRDMVGGGILSFLRDGKPMLDSKGADDRRSRNARADSL